MLHLTVLPRLIRSYILVGLGHLIYVINCFQINFYGISFTTLNNFAPFNSSKNSTTNRQIECLYYCAIEPGCQAIFFHSADGVCMLSDRKYADTSELQSFPGMKYFSTFPTLCSDLPAAELPENAQKQIDPDGPGTEFGPVSAWCALDLKPGYVVTYLMHNKRSKTYVVGYEACGSYAINITYYVGLEAAKKIIDMSSACRQFIRWDCYSAAMHSVQTADPCVRWKNRNMEYSTYFTGSGSYSKYCDCAQMNRCFHSSGCNCNENDREWRYDSGYVTNKEDLPITFFSAGDTDGRGNVDANEMAYHSIGGVSCW